MDKVMRDLAWKCLPKEARAYVREMHKSADQEYKFHKGKRYALEMTFGKSNLESDTEPEDMLIVERKKVQEMAQNDIARAMLLTLFGDKCLPDKPSNGAIGTTPPAVKLDVKQTPKFGKGNKVKVASGLYYVGETLEISDVEWDEEEYVYYFADKLKSIPEGRLEPYTEESRNLSQVIANCDKPTDNQLKYNMEEKSYPSYLDRPKHIVPTMEEKELNLAELLKGCEGEEFFNPNYGVITLKEMGEVVIVFEIAEGGTLAAPKIFQLNTGFIPYYPSEESFLKYPLDARKAWDEWASERKPKLWRAKLGEKYWVVDIELSPTWSEEKNDGYDKARYNNGNYFRTKEEAQQAAEAVRETLTKFHDLNQKQNEKDSKKD